MVPYVETTNPRLISLFSRRYPNDVLLRSFFEGNTPGMAYVDDPENPRFGLVISEFYHWTFLGGAPTAFELEQACLSILPQEEYLQVLWWDDLGLDKPRLEWDEVVRRTEFRQFAWTSPQAVVPGAASARVALASMPHSFLKTTLKYFYGSWDEFLSKAFAYHVLQDGAVVSEAIGIFQDSHRVEVSLETAEQFRRKGYGRLAASALIEESLRANKVPCWSCNSDNTASLETAKALGFSDPAEYEIYILNAKNRLSAYWTSLLDAARAREKSLVELVAYLQSLGLERNAARRISITYLNDR